MNFSEKYENNACIFLNAMVLYLSGRETAKNEYPGVAKFGIALEWGSRGRWFESSHSDQVMGSIF